MNRAILVAQRLTDACAVFVEAASLLQVHQIGFLSVPSAGITCYIAFFTVTHSCKLC